MMRDLSYDEMTMVRKLSLILGKSEKEIVNTPYLKLLGLVLDKVDVDFSEIEVKH